MSDSVHVVPFHVAVLGGARNCHGWTATAVVCADAKHDITSTDADSKIIFATKCAGINQATAFPPIASGTASISSSKVELDCELILEKAVDPDI
jgi:hypothetical protein